ncbi:MAG: MogA/MoaB family molybdenum cofactor biosynthesis protein [Pyrinomonadaceae bacterium]
MPGGQNNMDMSLEKQIRAVVITVSDRCARGEQQDESGRILIELLADMGATVVLTDILADDLEPLSQRLRTLADRPDVNLVITTGGTGLSPRDNTPEATHAVIEKEAPGLAEAMRTQTLAETRTAMLSRGVCGVRSSALIINLPGSPAGVRSCFNVIKPVLTHAVSLVSGQPSDHNKKS